MAVQTITRLPETLQGVDLAGQDDMLFCLSAAAGYGYTGEVSYLGATAAHPWRLRLNNAAQGDQFAYAGDWVVLDSHNVVRVLTAEAFAERYTA